MNVLIIDDSDLARAQIRRILVHGGIKVFEQASAIGATRNILRNAIDVALVDISMPGLSGDKLIGLLRNNPRLVGLVIIIVSAKSERELQPLVGPNLADAVLTKDRVEDDLVELVKRFGSRVSRRSGELALSSRNAGRCAK